MVTPSNDINSMPLLLTESTVSTDGISILEATSSVQLYHVLTGIQRLTDSKKMRRSNSVRPIVKARMSGAVTAEDLFCKKAAMHSFGRLGEVVLRWDFVSSALPRPGVHF